jgi:CBS domain-containing protein
VTVGEVMTRDVVVGFPLQQIEDCLETMNDHRIRHLPVVEKGVVVGMVSLRDLAAAELDRRQELLEKLDRFLLG